MSINFGLDPNEGQKEEKKFVWVKKHQKDSKKGISSGEREQRDAMKKQEMEVRLTVFISLFTIVQLELAKLSKRRAEREIEKELREEEQKNLSRAMNETYLQEWESKDESFQIEQVKVRARIRIKDGRPKPIDMVAINLALTDLGDALDEAERDDVVDVSLDEPYLIFDNLLFDELEELHKNISMYAELETKEFNKQYWSALKVVCDDELVKSHNRATSGKSVNGLNDQVVRDVDRLLESKTLVQLEDLRKQVEAKLSSGGPVDVDYWEYLRKSIVVWKSKSELKSMHVTLLKKRLEQLKRKLESIQNKKIATEAKSKEIVPNLIIPQRKVDVLEYDPCMSPVLLPSMPEEYKEMQVVDEKEDLEQLVNLTSYQLFPSNLCRANRDSGFRTT